MLKKIIVGFSILAILVLGFLYANPSPDTVYYARSLVSLDPTQISDYNNTRLMHVYESLVSYDQNLQIKPALVRSYGRLEEDLWKFSLKDNIVLHNQVPVNASYIKQVFEKLQSQSALAMHFDSMDTITLRSDYSFEIKLKNPDPLFLSKLAQIPIVDLSNPQIGSGPFQIQKSQGQDLHLSRFDSYHGNLPTIKTLKLLFESDTAKRLSKLNKSNTLAVLNVLPEQIQYLPEDFNYDSYSDLSSHFFLFNYQTQRGADPAFQKVIKSLLDNIDFAGFTKNQVDSTSQFIPKGVFGYDPKLINLKSSENLLQIPKYLIQKPIKIALSPDLEVFSRYLQNYFQAASLQTQMQLLDLSQASKQDLAETPLIFIGFKSDYADAQSFYESIAKKGAKYNFGSYHNAFLETQLEQLQQEFESSPRLQILQSLNALSLNYPALGVPVYENKVYYATRMGYNLVKRLDGVLDFYHLTQTP